jgi:glycosyltransferase involved in cell wall biosynthesis
VTAARRAGVPVVVSIYALPRDPQARRRLLAAAAQADAVIAGAGSMLPALAAEGAIAHDRIAVIPPGLDMARFHPSQVTPTLLLRLARRWRLPDHAPVALLPTSLQPGEGHELAVEALARLDERPLHLVLLGTPDGDQDHIKALLRFADDRGVGHRVCVVDDWDELPTAAILAETLLVTSPRLELADEALAVAQAMGRPVVALDHHGVAGLPSVGSLTWLSPPDSAAALAQALRAALDLPDEERMGLAPAGIEGVRAYADRAAACHAVLEVYGLVLARSDAPGRPARRA